MTGGHTGTTGPAGPGLSLTVTNAAPIRRAKVSNSSAPPKGADPGAARIRARVDLAAALMRAIGQDPAQQDLSEVLARSADGAGQIPPEAFAAAFEGQGLIAQVVTTDHLQAGHWPAIAQMTSGQYVLVLGQSGGALTIFDPTGPDRKAQVPEAEFTPFFAGRVIIAEAPQPQLAPGANNAGWVTHWFWSQFPRYGRQFAEIALASFVANLLAVAVALFALQVYDRVIPHQSVATLWVLAIGAGFALMLETCLKIARARLMDGAGRQIELKLQQSLMDRILGMRSELAGRSPHQVFSAMREFGSVREFFTASTVGTLADIPFLFVFLFLVASIAGNVVWVLIFGGIAMVLPSFFLQRRMIRLTEEMQGATAKSARVLHDTVFELDTVKTQRAEDRVRRTWTDLTALGALKSSDQRKLASTLTFWSQAIQQGTYVCAVIAGAFLVFAGEFTVGTIIAVGILTGRTLAPLTQLAGVLARWGNVKAALDGLEGIANAPQVTEAGRTYLRRDRLEGRFELRDMTFRYEEDGNPVLDISGVQLQSGQSVAILGANGSGKSTLLKVMSGLYAPSSGRVPLDGMDLAQIDPRDVRRMVGYLGQDVRLFAGTLRDNLNLAMLERDDARLLQALDFAGLGPFVREHHKGLDLEIGDGGQGLSIGQRQSVGWARLWLQDPRICLLDEPTAALDQTLEKTLISRLESWLAGRTAVIATHRVPILSLCSRTLILQNGRMAVDGPRDAVLAHLSEARVSGAGS